MPFLHIERYESIAHCGELLSATRGVLFVLKTPFFAKKIQKHEILPYKKQLFLVREQERPGVGTCAPIPVLFVTRGVINKFSQLSPGSLRYAGRNQQI